MREVTRESVYSVIEHVMIDVELDKSISIVFCAANNDDYPLPEIQDFFHFCGDSSIKDLGKLYSNLKKVSQSIYKCVLLYDVYSRNTGIYTHKVFTLF